MWKFLITPFPMMNNDLLVSDHIAGALTASADIHFGGTAIGLAAVPGGIVSPHGRINASAGNLVHPPTL